MGASSNGRCVVPPRDPSAGASSSAFILVSPGQVCADVSGKSMIMVFAGAGSARMVPARPKSARTGAALVSGERIAAGL